MAQEITDLVGAWKVSYAASKDLDQSSVMYYDGDLQLWSSNSLVLLDYYGKTLDQRSLRDGEMIDVGSTVAMPGFQARVLRCIIPLAKVRVLPSTVQVECLWKVSYSTYKDLDRDRLKSYDGTMQRVFSENWLVLKNAKGNPIAVLDQKDFFSTSHFSEIPLCSDSYV
jgi:hypothetical protein